MKTAIADLKRASPLLINTRTLCSFHFCSCVLTKDSAHPQVPNSQQSDERKHIKSSWHISKAGKGRFNKWRGGPVNRPDECLISLKDTIFPLQNALKIQSCCVWDREPENSVCCCLCHLYEGLTTPIILQRMNIKIFIICNLSLHFPWYNVPGKHHILWCVCVCVGERSHVSNKV